MNEMIMVWLVILILMIVFELISLGLTTIWFAGGAIVALIATVLQANLTVQIVLFLVVSLLLLYFTRPVAVKYFNKDREKTNVESLIGRQAIVVGEIDNLQGIGVVSVGGQEWSARNRDGEEVLPVGTVVEITAVSGVKLIVREKISHPQKTQSTQDSEKKKNK